MKMETFVGKLCECCGGAADLEVLCDETVMEYLRAAAIGEERLEMDDFMEVLKGFCPSLEVKEEKFDMVRIWYDEIESAEKGEQPNEAEKEVDGFRVVDMQKEKDKFRGKQGKEEAGEVEMTKVKTSRESNPELEQLAAICPPGANVEAIRFVLENVCGNEVEAAALYILDKGMNFVEEQYRNEMLTEEERAEESKERELAEQQKQKKVMMARFDEYAVTENAGTSKAALQKKAKKDMKRLQKMESRDKVQGQVRFFEGQIVSRKGEKFHVVDNGKDEWNGGSKGKIITKGKRGPGFVSG